jgi:hypothetical protein
MIIRDQNGYAGMKNIWAMALSPATATANQGGRLLTCPYTEGCEQLHGTEHGYDPAPGAQVAGHVLALPTPRGRASRSPGGCCHSAPI